MPFTQPCRKDTEHLSATGVKLHGSGFLVTQEKARELGLGRLDGLEAHIRSYRHGRDITSRPRELMVIDLDSLEIEEVRTRFPAVYQHVLTTVKPARDVNREPSRKQFWWRFGRRNTELRAALRGLRRYIATPETAKHRFFVFLDAAILPDNMLINIGTSDAFILGVLSSRIHVTWALAAGGRMGYGNDPRYNKTRCFEPFPFPEATEPQRERVRFIAEQLDAHRKRQQESHADLTLTEMYNVLSELRSGETLSPASCVIHDRGLVSVLRELHDQLDAAVAEAYGWLPDLADEEILFRLVDLNATRAAEERTGLIRWLRPEFQRTIAVQGGLDVETEEAEPLAAMPTRLPWPSTLPERVRAVRNYLVQSPAPVPLTTVARSFVRARLPDVTAILETLAALGQANRDGDNFRA